MTFGFADRGRRGLRPKRRSRTGRIFGAAIAAAILLGLGVMAADRFDILGPLELAVFALGAVAVIAWSGRRHREASLESDPAEDRRDREIGEMLLAELGRRLRGDLTALEATIGVEAITADTAKTRVFLSDLFHQIRDFRCTSQRSTPVPAGGSTVGMRNFLERFCAELRTLHLGVRPIVLDLDADDAILDPARAVVVGSIFYEGVTNALQHGFPDARPGCIFVRFAQAACEPGHLTLAVADNGIGLPPAPRVRLGAGLRWVHHLAAHVNGSATLTRLNGVTVLYLKFPVRYPSQECVADHRGRQRAFPR